MKVDWTFPDGNGREIVSQTVTLSGAVSDELDPKSKTWTSKALGLGKKVTVTVSYCVKDGTCSDTVTRDATTPSSLSLATVAVGALASSSTVGGRVVTRCTEISPRSADLPRRDGIFCAGHHAR